MADHRADSEARWRAVVEHAPDGILLTVLDGRVLAANAAACALLGRTEEAIRAAVRAKIALPDEAAARFLDERRRTGSARGVLTLIREDGSTFLADVASNVFDGEGGEVWTSMTFRDVTERERARRALEILADAGGHLASSLDLRTTLRHLTDLAVPRLADVCTVDLVEPDGIERVAVAHRDPSRTASFAQLRRRTLRTDAPGGVDYVLRTGRPSAVYALDEEWLQRAAQDRDHLEAWRALGVRSLVSVPLVARGSTIGALTLMSVGGVPSFGDADLPLVRALGERAAAAIDNAHRHAEAIEARRLRDEVLGVVAHDLRGPLNAILITAATLARKAPSRETQTIAQAVHRADVLIHDLLLATKADAGGIPLERADESIAAILDEVSSIHRPLADAKDQSLVVAIDGDLPRAFVDRHRIVQMLSNLVANAIKFTPPRGHVELRSRVDGDRIVFTVSDTGAGIDPADLPHVFDRYWQAARERHLGAGLGLAISRAIATAHGGDIRVESTPAIGTTFTIVLPIRGASVMYALAPADDAAGRSAST